VIREGISIIIPYFNAAAFIKETLDYLSKAVNERDEIIIVDDGSNEENSSYLDELLTTFGELQITKLKLSQNFGAGFARNFGIRSSKNSWLLNLDSDNLIPTNYIDALYSNAVLNELDVSTPECINFFRETPTEVTHVWRFSSRAITFQDHVNSNYVPSASGNFLFSRRAFDLAGGYPEFAGALDTWGFGLRLVATGSLMKSAEGISYFHRFGHDSFYARESKNRRKINLIATSLTLEYPSLVTKKQVKHMFSMRFKYKWFTTIHKANSKGKYLSPGWTVQV